MSDFHKELRASRAQARKTIPKAIRAVPAKAKGPMFHQDPAGLMPLRTARMHLQTWSVELSTIAGRYGEGKFADDAILSHKDDPVVPQADELLSRAGLQAAFDRLCDLVERQVKTK